MFVFMFMYPQQMPTDDWFVSTQCSCTLSRLFRRCFCCCFFLYILSRNFIFFLLYRTDNRNIVKTNDPLMSMGNEVTDGISHFCYAMLDIDKNFSVILPTTFCGFCSLFLALSFALCSSVDGLVGIIFS